MISEIEIGRKLSKIFENFSEENIVNSGRVQGINIYRKREIIKFCFKIK